MTEPHLGYYDVHRGRASREEVKDGLAQPEESSPELDRLVTDDTQDAGDALSHTHTHTHTPAQVGAEA